MSKVTIVGAGKYGSMTALRTAEYDIVDSVVMTDIVEGLPQGLALDMNQSRYVENFNSKNKIKFQFSPSLEAQIASISDDIAYNSHDLEDGLKSNLFSIKDLEKIPILKAGTL